MTSKTVEMSVTNKKTWVYLIHSSDTLRLVKSRTLWRNTVELTRGRKKFIPNYCVKNLLEYSHW